MRDVQIYAREIVVELYGSTKVNKKMQDFLSSYFLTIALETIIIRSFNVHAGRYYVHIAETHPANI